VDLAAAIAFNFHITHTIDNFLIDHSLATKVECSARYQSFNDHAKEYRDKFAEHLVDTIMSRPFLDDDTFILSKAHGDYDVLITGGNDPARMGRFIRSNSLLLNNVAKIALIHDSTPPRRTRLLNYGFDEVIDSKKMHMDEARLRLKSVIIKYRANRNLLSDSFTKRNAVSLVCNPDLLTPREFEIAHTLVDNINSFVSIKKFCSEINPSDTTAFKGSIKVMISNLRKKLNSGYIIKNDYSRGYVLINKILESSNNDKLFP